MSGFRNRRLRGLPHSGPPVRGEGIKSACDDSYFHPPPLSHQFPDRTYFTAVAYHWLDPEAAWIPSFCRMGERACSSIVHTPRARVLGLPNSVLGPIFYLALMAGIIGDFIFSSPFFYFYLAGSLLTVLLGIFLT